MKRSWFLLTELVRRDLASRFAGSFGGPLWALLNPLLLCALYSFVFSLVLRASPPPGFPASYAEFLLAGLLPWIGMQEAVLRGATAVTDQAHLVKKLRFPVGILVVTPAGSALLLQAMAMALLGTYVAVAGHGRPRPGLLISAFVLEALFLLGPILAVSAIHVYLRDVSQLLAPALMIVFYLTPIVYPDSMVPERFRGLLRFNPLADLVSLFRAGMFGSPGPPLTRLGLWTALALVVLAGGAELFRRCSRSFADLL